MSQPASQLAFLVRTAVFLPLLLLGPQQGQAQPDSAPRQMIDGLGLEIRKTLEDPQATVTPDDVERAVAEKITALIAASPGHLSLTAPDDQGRTPLMLATAGGYSQVVKALLNDASVRLVINVPDADGETAWMLANFAPTMTLVACQPGMLTLERAQLLPPYLRRLTYLLKTKGNALFTIVHDLEAAGAEGKPDEAKRAWLARCPNTTPELREALKQGDLMGAVIGDALIHQSEFNKQLQKDPSSVPVKPPDGMKFYTGHDYDKPHSPRSPLLQIGGMVCKEMPKPEMPKTIYWSGHILYRVVATNRAGVVESADVTAVSGSKEKNAVDFFRGVVLRALANYRCEGDHTFEQEFAFKVD